MRKTFIVFLLAALSLGAYSWPHHAISSGQEADFMAILKKVFDRPGDRTEKIVFIASDGRYVVMAGGLINRLTLKLKDIIEALGAQGLYVGNIKHIVHNHNIDVGFSPADYHFRDTLKKIGFVGDFHVYYPATGALKTLTAEEKK